MSAIDANCYFCDRLIRRTNKNKDDRYYCLRHQPLKGRCYREPDNWIVKNCPGCGIEFETLKRQSMQYCSGDCYQRTRGKRRVKKACPHCGKIFEYHKSWPRKYCSRKCSATVNGKVSRKRIKIECDYCGNALIRQLSQIKHTDHAFCDMACFGKWQSLNNIGPAHPTYNQVETECEQCGEPFMAKPSELEKGWARFCGRSCYAKWMSINRIGPDCPAWKGGTSDTAYYGPNWARQRNRARRRDGYRCQACGKHERFLTTELHVHHIIPFHTFDYVPGENDNHLEANKLVNLISVCAFCHPPVEFGHIDYQPYLL